VHVKDPVGNLADSGMLVQMKIVPLKRSRHVKKYISLSILKIKLKNTNHGIGPHLVLFFAMIVWPNTMRNMDYLWSQPSSSTTETTAIIEMYNSFGSLSYRIEKVLNLIYSSPEHS
jgi:hypothetical protein